MSPERQACRFVRASLRAILLPIALGTVFVPRASSLPIEGGEEITVGSVAMILPSDLAAAKRKSAREERASLLALGSLFWVVDDNVYRSPSALRQSASGMGGGAFLRDDHRLSRGRRLLSTIEGQLTDYRGHSVVSLGRGHWSEWYEHVLSRTTQVELDLDVYRQGDAVATIRGEDDGRDYGYWKYGLEGLLEWRHARSFAFKAGGEYRFKNYRETPGENSLDWSEWRLKALYRGMFASKGNLRLHYSFAFRGYDEEAATSEDGVERPGNPTERHHYHNASIRYETDASGRAGWDVAYEFETKRDLFAHYESYASHTGSFGLGWEVGDRLTVRGQASAMRRAYDRIAADDLERLGYTLVELGASARYRPARTWWVFGSLNRYDRNSNKSTGLLYRDYRGTVVSIGAGAGF